MTRINLTIDPAELCDQHLVAEYRELPRAFAVDPAGAPDLPCLGTGHVKWMAGKRTSLALRQASLIAEMQHRGFRVSRPVPPAPEPERWTEREGAFLPVFRLELRARIVERLRGMRRPPRWTRRQRPAWAV